MQVLCDEGVAIHIGPEPCVGSGEAAGEASAGGRIDQPLSRERRSIPGADALLSVEGSTDGRAIASARTTRRGRRPWHVRTLLAREPGDLTHDRLRLRTGPHREGEEPYRPRGSAATARASHPKLNRNHASTADRRARQKPAAMPMLQRSNRSTVAAQKYVIAVGALIAECLPHRSERAQFGHSAPTSGA